MFEHFSHDLRDLNFNEFLKSGFLIQSPVDSKIWLGVIDDKNESSTQCALSFTNFFQTNTEKYSPQKLFQVNSSELSAFIESKFSNEKTVIKLISDNEREYIEDCESILSSIKSTSLEKLVSVLVSKYEKNKIHPISQVSNLDKLNGHIYGMWREGKGFLGVSPEPLFILTGNKLETIALAGTIKTSDKEFENKLLEDSKERREHDYVIKDIIQKLESSCTEYLQNKTHIFNFGPIAHLKTNLEFIGAKVKPSKIINLLSPTAALGGYPANYGSKTLKKMNYFNFEGENREFGGTFCFEIENQSFALVCIRNIYWNQDNAFIHSGGGIVEDSKIDKELTEVKLKRATIEDVFTNE